MNSIQRLTRDIDTLRESIRTDWQELASTDLTPEARKGIRQHIALCLSEMANLLARLEVEQADAVNA